MHKSRFYGIMKCHFIFGQHGSYHRWKPIEKKHINFLQNVMIFISMHSRIINFWATAISGETIQLEFRDFIWTKWYWYFMIFISIRSWIINSWATAISLANQCNWVLEIVYGPNDSLMGVISVSKTWTMLSSALSLLACIFNYTLDNFLIECTP